VKLADKKLQNMRGRKLRVPLLRWALLCALLGGGAAHAKELRVSAPVISVTPVTSAPPAVCDVPAPKRTAGLAATLRWDLRGRCRESDKPEQITGYAVVYEWDGRRFNTVLSEAPHGDSLPLRLQID